MPAKVPVSLKLLLERGRRYLVLRDRPTGLGDLPGGRMEAGEVSGDWVAALHRELAEELGDHLEIAVAAEPCFAFPHRIQGTGEEALGLLWHGTLLQGEPRLSEEHVAAWWRAVEDGPDPALPATLAAAVARWHQQR